MRPFGRASDTYSNGLRTASDGVCSHSPLYPLRVRRRSNPSLELGARLQLAPGQASSLACRASANRALWADRRLSPPLASPPIRSAREREAGRGRKSGAVRSSRNSLTSGLRIRLATTVYAKQQAVTNRYTVYSIACCVDVAIISA